MGILDGKVVIVTGGSRGTGRAISNMLAHEGAAVGLVARGAGPLESAVGEIRAAGGTAIGCVADVADESAIESVVERVRADLGIVDALVNCAGIGSNGPVESLSLADWNSVIATNLTGAFVCSRAVIPSLRESGGGHIISISSGAGRQGYPNMAAYCASKFGLMGFMQSLAIELAPLGVHVCTIMPGSILTDFGSATAQQRRAQSDRKYIMPEDVAQAVVFLLTQPRRAWTQEMTLWPF